MYRMLIQYEDRHGVYVTVGYVNDGGDFVGEHFADFDYVKKEQLESYFAGSEPGVLELAREVLSKKRKFAIVELVFRVPRYAYLECAECECDDEAKGCGFVLKKDVPDDYDPDTHCCDGCK